MARVCEFCCKRLGSFDAYYRTVGRYNVTVCESCAVALDKRGSQKPEDISAFCAFARRTLAEDQLRPSVSDALKNDLDRIAPGAADLPEPVSSTADGESQPSFTGTLKPQVAFTDNVWVTVCRVMGVLALIGSMILGGVLSNRLGDNAVLGVFVGLLVGLVVLSFFMLIAQLCEDVSETRDYLAHLVRTQMNKDD
ncbi:MAG: hypothetical protein IK104_06795 [Clostridia bacterium]|nr:hypothetical protein [Clostridia bacterium]MBR5410362.1 hypothetical protein [Clostridia bacterium]